MSGAGLQGFTSGLERGVGLANTLIDSKRRRQFEDERMDMARQQFGMSQEQHDWSRDQQGRIAQQHEWQGQQQARVAEQHEQSKQQHQANMRIKRLQTEKAELERDMPIIQLGLQKAANGQFDMLTDEERAAFSRHKRFDPGWLASDKVGQALNVVEDTLRRATAGEPIDYNDPALIEAENVLFEFDLNKGGGGAKKRILRQGPGKQEGTMIFELDADGKRVPMTEGRATAEEGDNNVLQQPLDEMIKRVAGIRSMHNQLRQAGAQNMMQMAGFGGQSDKQSAKMQTYQDMIALGVPAQIARAESMGLLKTVTDASGTMRMLVDVSTNQPVGTVTIGENGSPIWTPHSPGQQEAVQPAEPEPNNQPGFFRRLVDSVVGDGSSAKVDLLAQGQASQPASTELSTSFPQAESVPGSKPVMYQGKPYMEYKGMAYPLDQWNEYIKQLQEAQHQTRSVEQNSMQTGAMRLPQGLMPQTQDQIQPF